MYKYALISAYLPWGSWTKKLILTRRNTKENMASMYFWKERCNQILWRGVPVYHPVSESSYLSDDHIRLKIYTYKLMALHRGFITP